MFSAEVNNFTAVKSELLSITQWNSGNTQTTVRKHPNTITLICEKNSATREFDIIGKGRRSYIQISLSARIQIQITNQAKYKNTTIITKRRFLFLSFMLLTTGNRVRCRCWRRCSRRPAEAADSPPGINKQTECAVRALRRDTPTENINARGGKRRYRTTLEKSAQKGLAGRRWMMESPSLLGAQCGSNRSRGRCCWRVSEWVRQAASVCVLVCGAHSRHWQATYEWK